MKRGNLLAAMVVLALVGAAGAYAVGGSEQPTPAAGKVTIHLWEKPQPDADPGHVAQYNAWMARVKAKFPDITIEDQPPKPGVDYRQQYDQALMADQAPTGTHMFPSGDIPTRIENGTIADITDIVKGWEFYNSPKVWPGFGTSLVKNGRTYAVPHDAYVMGVFINKKALVAGGGSMSNLPKTWAEFSKLGSKLTDPAVPRFGYELLGMDWLAWPYSPWVWSAGGEMVRPNADGTYRIAFNEDAGVDAAMYWNQMVWRDHMTQKDVLQDWPRYIDDITSGRAVFAFADLGWFNQENLAKVGMTLDDISVMPFPSKDSSIPQIAFTAGQVITINPKATKTQQKAAFDVLTYITYDEQVLREQWQLADKHGIADLFPSMRADLTDVKYSILTAIPASLRGALSTVSKVAKMDYPTGNWNDLKNALVKPLQQIVLKQGITRAEAKVLLDQCAEQLYTQYPNSFRKD